MAALLLIAVATCNMLDEAHFATIVHFWEQNLPSRDFELLGYMADGPHGSRLHVAVPNAIEQSYCHDFGEAFLRQKIKSDKAVVRRVACDLLLLRCPLLFKHPASVGGNGAHFVECVGYVVRFTGKTLPGEVE